MLTHKPIFSYTPLDFASKKHISIIKVNKKCSCFLCHYDIHNEKYSIRGLKLATTKSFKICNTSWSILVCSYSTVCISYKKYLSL